MYVMRKYNAKHQRICSFFFFEYVNGQSKTLKKIGNLSLHGIILEGLTLPFFKTPSDIEKPRKLFTTKYEKRRI